MRTRYVMGNWKMNGSIQTIRALLEDLVSCKIASQTVLFPPFVYIPLVRQQLEGSAFAYGAQNVFPKNAGAYTGEVSGSMLADLGCQYVLVGHSERRHLLHESEKFVAEKFHHVKDHGMIPVLCVGESQDERVKGLTERVIARQLDAINEAGDNGFQRCVIAYEPVWAIGTGKTASVEQAQSVHEYIRNYIRKSHPQEADTLSILYGGSVTEKNAAALFAMPDIDGGLVGGASLNAHQFVEIIQCIN